MSKTQYPATHSLAPMRCTELYERDVGCILGDDLGPGKTVSCNRPDGLLHETGRHKMSHAKVVRNPQDACICRVDGEGDCASRCGALKLHSALLLPTRGASP